jgi:hypothetical protein
MSRPVVQVAIDDDAIDGGRHGKAAIVGVGGGHCTEQAQQKRGNVASWQHGESVGCKERTRRNAALNDQP